MCQYSQSIVPLRQLPVRGVWAVLRYQRPKIAYLNAGEGSVLSMQRGEVKLPCVYGDESVRGESIKINTMAENTIQDSKFPETTRQLLKMYQD